MKLESTTAVARTAPAAAAPAAAAAPRVRAAAMAGDSYAGASRREKTNLAQPIGLLGFVVGGLGASMARGSGFFGFIAVAAAGLALAGTGVKVTMPDGSTEIAGLKGVAVLAPGAGLAVGGVAAMALGLSGLPMFAVMAATFGAAMLLARAIQG